MMLIPFLISSLLSASSLVLNPGEDIDYSEKDSDYIARLEHSHTVPPKIPVYQVPLQFHQGPPAPLKRTPSITGSHPYPYPSAGLVIDPSYVPKHTLPISSIVGVSDGEKGAEITTLERNVSVTSNMTDSQPFSQDELSSPTATRKPLSSPALLVDEWVIQSLYTTVKENDSSSKLSSCLALQEMARNENCLAKLAIAILCKDGHTEFGMREDEISEFVANAYMMFLFLYQTTNPAIFGFWHPLLKSHDLIRGS